MRVRAEGGGYLCQRFVDSKGPIGANVWSGRPEAPIKLALLVPAEWTRPALLVLW